MGSGDDVSNCVAFLSSEEASYITGETIHVNGGMYMALTICINNLSKIGNNLNKENSCRKKLVQKCKK